MRRALFILLFFAACRTRPFQQIAPPTDDLSAPTDAASAPDLARRDLSLTDLAAPDLSLPDLLLPDLLLPDLASPDLSHPDLSMPDLSVPDLATPRQTGCADGTREGFVDAKQFPNIAGCAGGFQIAGVLSNTLMIRCAHQAGNSGNNPLGIGCDVEDLCSEDFHVCISAQDVALHSPSGCTGAAPTPGLFFITRQSSNGCSECAVGNNLADPPCDGQSCVPGCAPTDVTANDVFGCGSSGQAPLSASCAPLDRFGNDLCSALPGSWSCGTNGTGEARSVIHGPGDLGGVLCCAN